MIDKKFSAGYEDISVTVVDYQRDIARHIWDCYKSKERIEKYTNEINKLIEKEVK